MRWPFRSKQREKDLEDEIAFDLAAEAGERVRAGASPDKAMLLSRRDLGNIALIREDVRETWGWAAFSRLAQDVRYGCRILRKNPLFAATAILSLALGIGSAAAIYRVMDAMLFRALPVRNPGELVILNWSAPPPPASGFTQPAGIDTVDGHVSMGPAGRLSADFAWPFYASLRDASDLFSTVFAYKDAGQLTVSVQGQAELDDVQFVSGNFFDSLGVHQAAGRLIDDGDNRASVAVVSFNYWRDRFAANPSVIGQTIHIGRLPFTICGVAAPEFFGIAPGSSPALYVPVGARPRVVADSIATPGESLTMFVNPRYYWIDMMARLRPGVTMARAQAEIAARLRRFGIASGANRNRADFPSLWLEAGGSGLDSLRRQYSKPLFVLMIMVAFFLAIACANIANLLLARASARRREMAVRLGLGAGRARVLRQLLTESLLLALPGGLVGLAVADAGIRFLLALAAGGDSGFSLRAPLDWRVFLFAFAVAAGAGILFGLAPALEATRVEIAPTLKGTRTGVERAGRAGMKRVLVAVQIALSFLLVYGAVLFVQTLAHLQSVELGFNTANILTFNLNASKAGYHDAALNAFYNRVEERLLAVPGVRAVAASAAPLAVRFYRTPVLLPGDRKGNAGWNSVSPSFFETMQIPILAGRALDPHDVKGTLPVAVVNDAFAKAYFPGKNPIGQYIATFNAGIEAGKNIAIVGVSANARESLKESFSPFVYFSDTQFPAPEWRGMSIEVRAQGNPLALARSVQDALHEAAPDVPAADMTTLENLIDNSFAQERAFARLSTAFAILALLIAAIGLYGSMAYAVARRTGEIGIRIALGAQRASVRWMVMREALALTAAGLAVGFLCARAAIPAIKSFLFGVTSGDPSVIAPAAGLLIVSSLLAGYLPARRASEVDPMEALRYE